jgi:hypothetical protein
MKHVTVTSIVLAGLAFMGVTALCAQDPAEPTLTSARSTVETNRRKLWQSSIQTPEDDGDAKALQDAIDRLQRSMGSPKPAVITTRPHVANPTKTKTVTTQPGKKDPTTKPAPTTQPSMTVADRIKKLNSIADPAALADALFQAKYPELAAAFYERAAKAPGAPETKAWVLFQMANCSSKTKPLAALKAYDALVAEHPGSLWSDIALVQKGILTWRSTNNLTALLKDIEKQGQQSPNLSQRN